MTKPKDIAKLAPPASRKFLRELCDCEYFLAWDARRTVWANSLGLLKKTKKGMELTALGRKVVEFL